MIKYDEIDDMTKNSINTILERNGIVWSLEDEKLITINDLAIQLNMAIDTLKKHITRRLNTVIQVFNDMNTVKPENVPAA